MRAGVALLGLWCGLTLVAPGAAQSAPISIWYRSTEGCPGGAQFIDRLRELGRDARLASVGDPIHFVVTLGEAGAESSGRLERQTNEGTIAIRQVRAAECSAVADALAFSLDLALGTGEEADAADAEPAPEPADATASTRTYSQPTQAPRQARRSAPATDASAPTRSGKASVAAESRPLPASTLIRVGAQGELVTALLPSPLFGAGLFLDYELAPQAAGFRLTAHGAGASWTREGYELSYAMLAGRLDACPLAWNAADWQLRPCITAEGGAVTVDYSSPRGVRDTAPWFSAGLLARARWSAGAELAVEATLGASAAFIRYGVKNANEQQLARTRSVAAIAAVGVAFGPW